jgi:hypothetical protein
MADRKAADERLREALERTGAPDPRPLQRENLLRLKQLDPGRYQQAVRYYEEKLLPEIARGESEPLTAWLEYGCFLATLRVDGTPVQIDRTGRSEPYRPPVPTDRLVLHLPTSTREAAIAVSLPAELSPAQKATYDLLVQRRVG